MAAIPTYPDLPFANRSEGVLYGTDVARFDTGHQVRSGRWNRSLRDLTLQYDLLQPAWWLAILNLFERQRGGLNYFRFDDYVDTTPRGRQFGVGDGVTTIFHIPHDYTESAVVYADGDAVSAVYVDPETGDVQFATAPARGVDLTYDADNAAFRMRFGDDEFRFRRLHWGGYSGTVRLEQVATLPDVYPIRQVVHGGTLANATLDAVGEAIGYSFVCPVGVTALNVSYYVDAQVEPATPPAQTVRVSICANSSGSPGAVLAYGDHTPSTGWQIVTLDDSLVLTQGTRYWVTVEAYADDWGGDHSIEVKYTSSCPDTMPGEDQDDLLWGGYVLQDRRPNNTPHSWLGVATRAAGGSWTARNADNHPAFFINTSGTIVGHCQGPLTQGLYGSFRTRESFPLETVQDIVIDRVGGVFSTNGTPADSLWYGIVLNHEIIFADRALEAPLDTGGVPIYIEMPLDQPLTISPDTPEATPTGLEVHIVFYSPNSLVGAPWTHYGHTDSWSAFASGWEPNWNSVRWAEDESRAKISDDAGATYGTEIMGAWTVRCRGKLKP